MEKGYKKLKDRIEKKNYRPSSLAVAKKMYDRLRAKEKKGTLTKEERALLVLIEF